jgi:hypothetical protein
MQGRFMSEADGQAGGGQSESHLSVALAYRNAYLAGASESDCWPEAVKAILYIHPFLSHEEAEKHARQIVAQFSERFPGWLVR